MNYKVQYQIVANGQELENAERIVSASDEMGAAITLGLALERELRENPGKLEGYKKDGAVDFQIVIDSKGVVLVEEIDAKPQQEKTGPTDPLENEPIIKAMRECNAPEEIIYATKHLFRIKSAQKSPLGILFMEASLAELAAKVEAKKKKLQNQAGEDHPVIKKMVELGLDKSLIDEGRAVIRKIMSSGNPFAKEILDFTLNRLLKEITTAEGKVQSCTCHACQKQRKAEALSDLLEATEGFSEDLEFIKEKSIGTCRVKGRPGYIISHDEQTGHAHVFCPGGFNHKSETHEFEYKDGKSSSSISMWVLKGTEQTEKNPAEESAQAA